MLAKNNYKKTYLYLVAAIWFQLALVLPALIFVSNRDEFTVALGNMLLPVVAATAFLAIVILLFIFILPSKLSRIIFPILFTVAFGIYIQSNFLVWSYGQFDGNIINWNEFTYSGLVDVSVWLGIFLITFIFWKKSQLFSTLLFVVVLAQAFNLVQNVYKVKDSLWTATREVNNPSLFEFGKEQNTVMILLDMFESPALGYLLHKQPELKERLRDFTFYRNTTGYFPTTSPSIPSILTGFAYDNSKPMKQFQAEVLPKSLPSKLFDANHQVDLVTLFHYCVGQRHTSCRAVNDVTSQNFSQLVKKEALKLSDIVLFRASPQGLKKLIYNDEKWFFERLFTNSRGARQLVTAIEFGQMFAEQAKLGDNNKAFKFLHLLIPHSPFQVNEKCEFAPRVSKRVTDVYGAQCSCALNLALGIVEKMKQLGIYENSNIVILADHGSIIEYKAGKKERVRGLPNLNRAQPLLLIKKAGEKKDFSTSDVPAELVDIAKTVASLNNIPDEFPGENIFNLTEDSKRSRYYRAYKWTHSFWQGDFLPNMQEYEINGHPADPKSWKFNRDLPPGGK